MIGGEEAERKAKQLLRYSMDYPVWYKVLRSALRDIRALAPKRPFVSCRYPDGKTPYSPHYPIHIRTAEMAFQVLWPTYRNKQKNPTLYI